MLESQSRALKTRKIA